jgi:hypothetical protein
MRAPAWHPSSALRLFVLDFYRHHITPRRLLKVGSDGDHPTHRAFRVAPGKAWLSRAGWASCSNLHKAEKD